MKLFVMTTLLLTVNATDVASCKGAATVGAANWENTASDTSTNCTSKQYCAIYKKVAVAPAPVSTTYKSFCAASTCEADAKTAKDLEDATAGVTMTYLCTTTKDKNTTAELDAKYATSSASQIGLSFAVVFGALMAML